MKKLDQVYQTLISLEAENPDGVSAQQISEAVGADRTNISRYLNQLERRHQVVKILGRPVLYRTITTGGPAGEAAAREGSLERMVGAEQSLRLAIQQAKAAVLYPPQGLHTLLLGETGAGKSMFAEMIYQFAAECGVIAPDAPFVRFNCADYANNPSCWYHKFLA